MRRVFSANRLRQVVLGVSAAPLVIASGCGRTMGSELELYELGSVIPSKDAGVPDSGVLDAGWCPPPVKSADAGWNPVFSLCGVDVPTMHHGLVRWNDACRHAAVLCDDYCRGGWTEGCHFFESPEPSEVVCWQSCIGRLVDGASPHASGSGLGGVLASMAAHEGAAAIAFAQLADELHAHAAPATLVHAARRAAREEQRHTQLVGDLAHAHGGVFGVSLRAFEEPRTLEAIALENAREGCVRETLGAMVGLYQATHAPDAQVRGVMAQVSADELGHAAWSHSLASVLEGRLSRAARRRVREAREEALSTAATELAASSSAALGMPDEERLHALAASLQSWS